MPLGTTFEDLVAKRLGPVGQVHMALQCGCGALFTVTGRDGESHHDLADRLARRESDHIALSSDPDVCRPWCR